MTFYWLVTSLPMYLKCIGLGTDHTQVQKNVVLQRRQSEADSAKRFNR